MSTVRFLSFCKMVDVSLSRSISINVSVRVLVTWSSTRSLVLDDPYRWTGFLAHVATCPRSFCILLNESTLLCRHVDSRSIDDPTSPMAQAGPRCGRLSRPGDYICYKQVSFWSTTFTTTEAWVGSSFWTGTPVGTSSSIGQRVVVLDTAAEGGGGGGGGDITTSGSPARSQSNLQRILSGWSPPAH